MSLKGEFEGIPRALSTLLARERPEGEALLRRAKWSDELVYLVGRGSGYCAAMRGALAIETLLGWPSVVRSTTAFRAYSLSALRPRSLVILIPEPREVQEILQLVRAVQSRGAAAWVFGGNSLCPAEEWRPGAADVPLSTADLRSYQADCCLHVALSYFAFTAARFLKGAHSQHLENLERDFQELPKTIEWLLTHFSDAAQSLAAAIASKPALRLLGGGYSLPTALQAARWFEDRAACAVQAADIADFNVGSVAAIQPRPALVLLGGSRSSVKSQLHDAARALRQAGLPFLSITDRDDRELAARSEMAILLPSLSEMAGSLLALVLLGLVAASAARVAKEKANPQRPQPPGSSVKAPRPSSKR